MTWNTKVINESGTTVTVNGASLAHGTSTTLNANGNVSVVVPEVGTARFVEPGSDNYHQYIPTTWAVKVIAGDYVRYWSYEGGPLLTVTIHDNRTFSLPMSCNISFDKIPIVDHPLTQYSGVFQTNTDFWGDTFSPLYVNDDGTVAFGSTTITPSFNLTTATVSFDWTRFKTTTFKATFSFVGIRENTAISGGLNPRPSDGPVNFVGNLQTFFQKPSLSNIRAFDTFMKNGDVVDFKSQPAHLPLVVDSQHRLTQAATGNPARFTVGFADDILEGFTLQNTADQKYLASDTSGQLLANADQSSATRFHLYICMDGDIMIGSGDAVIPQANIFMKRDPQASNRVALNVAIIKAAADRTGDDPPLPCDVVHVQFLAKIILGVLPILGLGEFTLTGAISRELKAVGGPYLDSIKLAFEQFVGVVRNAGATGALAVAGGVVLFIRDIYTAAPDLINKWLRIAWEGFGFWDYTKAAASIALMFVLPENPAHWARVVATFTVYISDIVGTLPDLNRCPLV